MCNRGRQTTHDAISDSSIDFSLNLVRSDQSRDNFGKMQLCSGAFEMLICFQSRKKRLMVPSGQESLAVIVVDECLIYQTIQNGTETRYNE